MMPVFNEIIEINANVYRNILKIPPNFDEFGDLTSDHNTRKYAHQITESPYNHQYQAIDYVFKQSSWLPTRYGTGQFPVWYAAVDLITSFYETLYHWQTTFLIKPNFKMLPRTIKVIRSVYTVKCQAALIDLRNKTTEYPELIDPNSTSYRMTQKLGVRMHKEGYPGLLTRSARKSDGENVVVFKDNILTNPTHYHDYIYEYDAISKNGMVKSNITGEVLIKYI